MTVTELNQGDGLTEDGFVFPMSFAQQRLWFLHQLEPKSTFYNLPLAVPFNLSVNVAVLERCINEIIGRHETLRTVFCPVDGEPMQIVRPSLSLRLETFDLRAVPPEEQSSETTRCTAEMAQRPFNLATGPLLRAALLRRSVDDNVFVLVIHHIIADGWSLGVFWRELVALYDCFYLNLPSKLPDLPIQYADFAVWQREQLRGDRLNKLTTYWRQKLDGLLRLQLPTDRPRPPVLSYRGAFQELTLTGAAASAMRSLSKREGVTPFMTLFAAFAVVMQRYSGQDDIVVGLPTASRDRSELEGLIGFFINSLVLRVDLSGDPTFRELLARVRETALDAYEHQELPFEKLVEELQPERDLSSNPLFQISFQLFSAPGERPQARQGKVEPAIMINRGSAIFDLAFNLWEASEGVGGQIEYSTDLFDASTIERLSGHFRTLLKNACSNPDKRLSDLQMLSETERRQLLNDWNDTAMAVPQDCVHRLVEQVAVRQPSALAVVARGKTLDYGELNRCANRVAARLREVGVRGGSLVCICVERGTTMIIAMLAVLKAGGAYVPLDPSYPSDRLGYMLDDSGAKVVLTDHHQVEKLPDRGTFLVLLVDDAALDGSDSNPDVLTDPDDVAYVIYTSGSTGRPKGVVVPHRGLMNLSAWHGKAFGVSADDRASQVASFSFDACGWEIWPYLVAGASVHVIDDDIRASPTDLVKALIDNRITIGFLPTPLAQIVFDVPGLVGLGMRYMLIGGDKLTRPVPSDSSFTVVNNYGPTEYSVVATTCSLGVSQKMPTPIGRPIANTQAYVLDATKHPVPIGVTGELYLGGDGLATGYHNRPALTAEAFVRNPIADTPGKKLYRTGDLVRFREDGTLIYLGRADDQVKIRGFRIELGEVEVVLTGHRDVSDAIVKVAQRGGEGHQLVAYVVMRHHRGRNRSDSAFVDRRHITDKLRAFIRERLPEYMVPSDIVVIEHLPLTPNGKVDRDALPPPETPRTDLATPYATAKTPLEEVLVGLWTEVLDLDRIDINDNFFEVGGHSLLAASLISLVRQRLKVEVPLKALFRAPTPALFAASLLESTDKPAALEKVAAVVASLASLSEDEVKQMLARPA
jgi:amino acid adenylation domain-containing protein